jgi:hypothetical protein
MADFESQVLENGLLIENIPADLLSQKICLNALKWALKIYKTNDYISRRELCYRIMNCFPKEILLNGFVMGHLNHFS